MQTRMPRFVRILVVLGSATLLGAIGFLTSSPNGTDKSGAIPEDVSLTTVSHTTDANSAMDEGGDSFEQQNVSAVTSEPEVTSEPVVEPAKQKRRFTMPVRRRPGTAQVASKPIETQPEAKEEEFDTQPNLPTVAANEDTTPTQVQSAIDTVADDLPTSPADQVEPDVSADFDRVNTSPSPEVNAEPTVSAKQNYVRTEPSIAMETRKQPEVPREERKLISKPARPKAATESKPIPKQVAERSQSTQPQADSTKSTSSKVTSFQLRIENPQELGTPLAFTYRRKVRNLKPGDAFQIELGASGKAIVQFERGENRGRAIRTLTSGRYAFRATKRGWNLVRIEEERK